VTQYPKGILPLVWVLPTVADKDKQAERGRSNSQGSSPNRELETIILEMNLKWELIWNGEKLLIQVDFVKVSHN
jgi:hypothetical protein